jgi:DNA-binding NarL/FixJ family response regulator
MKINKISVAIVDDHALFRKGLMFLLQELDAIEVLFEAENGSDMQHLIKKGNPPAVILMDIKMPVMDGYQATSYLGVHYPQVKVLALSMYEDDRSVLKMIRCGAGGYILKSSRPGELLHAITTIAEKGFFINERVSGKLIKIATQPEEQILSINELKFLELCCSEMSYKEIAELLFVSPRTIDNYRDSLFEKLGIKSRTGLVLYAIKNEIFKL